MIRACIFDMDGLLVDSQPVWFAAISRFLALRGCEYTPELRRSVMGMREEEATAILKNLCNLQESLPVLQAARREEVRRAFEAATGLTLMPGARALLESLHGKLPLALASSSRRELVNIALQRTAMEPYFSAVVAAEDVVNGKPAPDPFLLAAELLKVSPADCLVFEDAPNGVAAAKAAGMRCVAVCHAHSPREHLGDADLVLDSLADFSLRTFDGSA